MTIKEYAKIVYLMRQKQDRYFKNRTVTNLWDATAAERRVDELTYEVLQAGEEAGNQLKLPLYGGGEKNV